MKQKDEILQKWHVGMNAEVKYLVPRNLVYADVDKHVFDFFNRARAKNMPGSRPMLREEALSFPVQNGHDNFQGSNGWLTAFLKRHKIKFAAPWEEFVNVDENLANEPDDQCSEVAIEHLTECASTSVDNMDQNLVEIDSLLTLQEAAKMMKKIRSVYLNNETLMKHATVLQHYFEQESIEQKMKQAK